VPLYQVRRGLVGLFRRWGKPGAMRVDNGEPLGSPTHNTTSALALWLIGFDIDMIFNKPYCPQSNAKVERLQDISARWADIEQATDWSQLQSRLDEQARFHREQFAVSRLQGKTRLETFPELETSRRVFDPQSFQPQRVYDFLAKKIYTRCVSKVGQIDHFRVRTSLGVAYKNQYVQLQLDPVTCQWKVFAAEQLIKSYPADNLTKECLLNLTVYAKELPDET
jgi:hypothetical protein